MPVGVTAERMKKVFISLRRRTRGKDGFASYQAFKDAVAKGNKDGNPKDLAALISCCTTSGVVRDMGSGAFLVNKERLEQSLQATVEGRVPLQADTQEEEVMSDEVQAGASEGLTWLSFVFYESLMTVVKVAEEEFGFPRGRLVSCMAVGVAGRYASPGSNLSSLTSRFIRYGRLRKVARPHRYVTVYDLVSGPYHLIGEQDEQIAPVTVDQAREILRSAFRTGEEYRSLECSLAYARTGLSPAREEILQEEAAQSPSQDVEMEAISNMPDDELEIYGERLQRLLARSAEELTLRRQVREREERMQRRREELERLTREAGEAAEREISARREREEKERLAAELRRELEDSATV